MSCMTFCPLRRLVRGTFGPWDVLSLGRFVPWDLKSVGRFVPWDLKSLGRFVLGRFVCALYKSQLLEKPITQFKDSGP